MNSQNSQNNDRLLSVLIEVGKLISKINNPNFFLPKADEIDDSIKKKLEQEKFNPDQVIEYASRLRHIRKNQPSIEEIRQSEL